MSPRYLFFLIESSLGLDIYDWGNFLIRMKWPIPSGKNFPRRMVKFAVRAINTVKRVRNWKGSKKHCLRILKLTFHWEVFVLVSWLWRHWHWFRLSVTVCRFCIWNWLLGWIIHDFYILVVQRWGRVQSLSDCYLRWMPVQSHYHYHIQLSILILINLRCRSTESCSGVSWGNNMWVRKPKDNVVGGVDGGFCLMNSLWTQSFLKSSLLESLSSCSS